MNQEDKMDPYRSSTPCGPKSAAAETHIAPMAVTARQAAKFSKQFEQYEPTVWPCWTP